MTQPPVGVIQFGSQFTQLIVRKIRELGIYSEMVDWEQAEAWIRANHPRAIILSGGPKSVTTAGSPTIDLQLIQGIPTLGICYGMQLLAQLQGGEVVKGHAGEFGVECFQEIAEGIASHLESQSALMSHGDQVVKVPNGFTVTASTEKCPIAAMENRAQKVFGLQWHPEVSHSKSGKEILRRFLFDEAGLEINWTSEGFIDAQIKEIQSKVGGQSVICAVSGGVDSTVMAALMHRAIGKQAVFVFVDTGLLRKNEGGEVAHNYRSVLGIDLHVVDASDQYFRALKGVSDPEAKRKIIGTEFINVFQNEKSLWADCGFLAQGTLYPDVIESGTSSAAKIKSHHNVGGLPETLKLPLIEPFRFLFKDEVRAVGRLLGIPNAMVEREPFPGPGLGIRVVGEVTKERVKRVQEADAIYREELKKRGLTTHIWQSYAGMLDCKTVGVQGDERTYTEPIVLRAIESTDGMTVTAVDLPISELKEIAKIISDRVEGVNRVLYDLSGKPPATVELE